MTDTNAALQARIEELEIKHEVLGIITTALLAIVPKHEHLVVAVETATELHDANLLYATSLSDDQRQRVLEHLRGFLDAIESQRTA